MNPMARQMDQIVGVDIHIVKLPNGVPVPLPHPFVGMVFDPIEMLPIIGSQVMSGGVPRAVAGSPVIAVPPHIPMGAGWMPPEPTNDGEVFMGSSTVAFDDEAVSYMGLPAITCQSIGNLPPNRMWKKSPTQGFFLPTSAVLPTPSGVLIGGAPTISFAGLAAGVASGKALSAFSKWKKGSKAMRKVSDKMHKAAEKIMEKAGVVSERVKNAVSKSICTLTGHPVDVATGKLLTDEVDFLLDGPIPIEFERTWYSSSGFHGCFGHGWHHNYDLSLLINRGVLILRLADGRYAGFEPLAIGESCYNDRERLTLTRVGQGLWQVKGDDGLIYSFDRAVGRDPVQDPYFEEKIFLSRIQDSFDHTIEFSYQRDGRIDHVVDSVGRKIKFSYDRFGHITEIAALVPEQGILQSYPLMRYAYDAEGNLIQSINPRSRDATISYAYQNHLLVEERTVEGTHFYFEWDDFGLGIDARCTKTWGDHGLFYRELDYSEIDANLTRVKDGKGGITEYLANYHGLVIREKDPIGRITKTTWSDQNQILKKENLTGEVLEYTYDEKGNVLTECSSFTGVVSYTYDENNNVVEAKDSKGQRQSFEYNNKNQIIKQIDPTQVETRFEYDKHGYLARELHPLGVRIYEWDSAGRLIGNLDRLGNKESFAYDSWGHLVKKVDGKGGESSYQWDAAGNLTSLVDEDGAVQTFAYDAASQLVKHRDAIGRSTKLSYGPLGVLNKIKRADGSEISRFYDNELELVALENPQEKRWSFGRDMVGRIINERSFDGRLSSYELDQADRISKVTGPDERVTEYHRNEANGLLEAIAYPDERKVEFKYDESLRLVGTSTIEQGNIEHEVALEYDEFGRLTVETQNGRAIEYKRDPYSRLSEMVADGAEPVSYLYDSENQLSGVRSGAKEIARFDYDRAGFEIARSLGRGVVEQEISFTATGRLKQQKTMAKGFEYQRGFVWNEAGELEKLTNEVGKTTEYVHDQIGRLSEILHPDKKLEKVLQAFEGDVPGIALYKDTEEHMAKVTVKDGYELFWDIKGRLRGKRGKGKLRSYAYNDADQLIGVYITEEYKALPHAELPNPDQLIGNVVLAHYSYDSFGRRLSKKVWRSSAKGEVLSRKDYEEFSYLYSGNQLIAEQKKNISHENQFIYKPGSFDLLAKKVDSAVFYVESDHIQTPVRARNEKGEVVWESEQEAFGLEINQKIDRAAFDNFILQRFQGQWYDEESGLAYNRFRYYDAELKMYTQPDPIGLAGGLEPYGYVDDPLGWVDPYGLSKTGSCGPGLSQQDLLKNKARAEYKVLLDKKYKGELTNKEIGPCLSVAMDLKTGRISKVHRNNIDGDSPSGMSGTLKAKMDTMPPDIGAFEKTRGAGSHAEVYAADELLKARPDAKLDEIAVFTMETKIPKYKGRYKPACVQCDYILDGVHYVK